MSHDGTALNDGTLSVITGATRAGEHPGIGPDEPAAHAVRWALLGGDARLRQNEPAARRGDVEGVHRMRTAARRLRSDLHLFRNLIEGDWAERLAQELQWLGRLLGAARDLDVMRERLRKCAGALVEDFGPMFTALGERHTLAATGLREALEGGRYRNLVEQLSDAAEHTSYTDEAWEPCRKALPSLVREPWKRLRTPGRALDLRDADEDFHEVRKRAKHARYGAEAVAPALDPDDSNDARRFARRAAAVQDILGEHQDATIACQEIRRIVAERSGDGPFNLVAGRLLERQEAAAEDSRATFFKIWHKLDRKKNCDWMKD